MLFVLEILAFIYFNALQPNAIPRSVTRHDFLDYEELVGNISTAESQEDIFKFDKDWNILLETHSCCDVRDGESLKIS
jgi:hypothetical protein